MNNNKLKKFIWEHRDEFDDEVPSEKVWQNIGGAFSEKKKTKAIIAPLYKWSMAAAAVLVISISTYLMLNKKPGITEPPVAKENPESNNLPPEFFPVINPIASTISMKQEELKTLAKDQPELYERFTNDISKLDSSYNILKNQLKATPNKEVLLEAMIQNLQLQLNVLNQQLSIINQIKQSTVKKV